MQSTSPGPRVLGLSVAGWYFEHRLHGPLIEPDQFIETASWLAQLPHQRDSNNCTLWPLPDLKNMFMFASKQAWQHPESVRKNAGPIFFFVNCLDTRSLWSSLGREQR